MVRYPRKHRKMVIATFSLITDHTLTTAGKLHKTWTTKILYITFMIMVMMMTMLITLKFIVFFFKIHLPKSRRIIRHNAYHSSNKYTKITWIIPGHLWICEMNFTWNAITDDIFLLFPLTWLVTIVICNGKCSLNFLRISRFLEIVHNSILRTETCLYKTQDLNCF